MTGTRSGTRQRPPSVIDHGPLRRLIVAIDFDSASIDSTACPRAFLLLLLLLFIGYFFHLEPAQPTRSRMLKKKKRERNHHPSLLSLMVLASIVSSVSNRIFTEFFCDRVFLSFFGLFFLPLAVAPLSRLLHRKPGGLPGVSLTPFSGQRRDQNGVREDPDEGHHRHHLAGTQTIFFRLHQSPRDVLRPGQSYFASASLRLG